MEFFLLDFISMLLIIIYNGSFVAAGLFYLAELVEEYTVLTAKIIKSMLIVSIRLRKNFKHTVK